MKTLRSLHIIFTANDRLLFTIHGGGGETVFRSELEKNILENNSLASAMHPQNLRLWLKLRNKSK